MASSRPWRRCPIASSEGNTDGEQATEAARPGAISDGGKATGFAIELLEKIVRQGVEMILSADFPHISG
jgi:hypothetical protein